jgi:hypothetical protein
VDYAAIAERLLRKYPAESLSEHVRHFDFKSGDLPANDQQWNSFRARGFMTLNELADLSRWKTGGRQDRNIARNSGEAVQGVTRAATSAAGEVPDEPGLAVGILTVLHGVDLPTASTVMTVWKPERFGILDIRAWNVLRAAVPAAFASVESVAGNRRPFRLEEADTYLRVIREVAVRASLSCRAVDKALWVLGGAP